MRLLATLSALTLGLGTAVSAQQMGPIIDGPMMDIPVLELPNCGTSYGPTGGCVTPTQSDGAGNAAYVGIQFVIGSGEGITPKIIAGYRSTKLSDDGRTSGVDLAVRFAAGENGFMLDSVVLSGLTGEGATLGRLGAGYSFTHSSWLGSAAIERGQAAIGADYAWSAGVAEFFSEFALRQENPETLSCPSGFTLRDIDRESPKGPDQRAAVRKPTEEEALEFFVLYDELLVGETTCEPDEYLRNIG